MKRMKDWWSVWQKFLQLPSQVNTSLSSQQMAFYNLVVPVRDLSTEGNRLPNARRNLVCVWCSQSKVLFQTNAKTRCAKCSCVFKVDTRILWIIFCGIIGWNITGREVSDHFISMRGYKKRKFYWVGYFFFFL